MKNILTILLLILTLNVSSQDKEVTKFKTYKYGIETKLNGEWERFSEWNLVEDTILIIIEDKETISLQDKESVSTYDIYDYSTGKDGIITFTKFFTIDNRGDECTVVLTSEEDENGEKWVMMYFYYKTIKVVYNLY